MQSILADVDIAAFTETHVPSATAAASLSLCGFVPFHCPRPRRHRSCGGVAVYVRAHLADHVTVVGVRSAAGFESVWFRVSCSVLDLGGKDLLVGAVYASPDSSAEHRHGVATRLSARDVADTVIHELLSCAISSFQLPTDLLLLAGDFNARIGGLSDAPDPSLFDHVIEMEQLLGMPLHGGGMVTAPVSPPVRASEDVGNNAFGSALMALCSAADLLVLNGRVSGDMTGALTYRSTNGRGGGSVIDLFLASSVLLGRASSLEVRTHRCEFPLSASGVYVPVSDHRPVVLSLAVMRADGGAPPPAAAARRPRLGKFDVQRWSEYGRMFTAQARCQVDRITDGLEAGSIAVDDGIKTLHALLEPTFRQARRRLAVPPLTKGDPRRAGWWTAECATARLSLLDYYAALAALPRRARGGRRTDAQQQELRTRRAVFQRAQRAAQAEWRARELERLAEVQLKDGWSLFRKVLHEPQAPCPISDLDAWHDYGSALFASSRESGSVSADVHRILNLINSRPLGGEAPLGSFADVPADRDAWLASLPVSERAVAATTFLDAPLSLAEVELALGRIAFSKSAGPDRAPGEAWRCARDEGAGDAPGEFIFGPCLAALFDRVFTGLSFPAQFQVSTWAPIYKKGDPLQCSNYRGIAVGGVLAKLYMSILTARLQKWGRAVPGVRHPAQAGFVRGLGTHNHQFIMRHLVSRYSLAKGAGRAASPKPLFVCQIDFAKAFDTVPHPELWERLRERGVQGTMLTALQQAYARVLLQPKVNGQLGTAFPCGDGVKQGDPASPELFGLFIEVFPDFVDAMDAWQLPVLCPTTGQLLEPFVADSPQLEGDGGPVSAPSILFADDINLVATSAARMRYLLCLLSVFCAAFRMRVNVPKCEALVFHPNPKSRTVHAAEPLTLDGQVIPVVARARYLGLFYGPPASKRAGDVRHALFTGSDSELLAVGKRGTYALHDKLGAHGMSIPHTCMVFYNTCIRSVFSFGAQVWSTPYLTSCFSAAMKHPMVVEQRAFMQRLAGARKPASHLLYAEFAQLPFQHHWATLVLRFWNSMTSGDEPPGSLCRAAFRSDVRMALTHRHGWVHDVLGFLLELGFAELWPPDGDIAGGVSHYCSLTLPVVSLLDVMGKRLMAAWHADGLPPAVDPRTYFGPSGPAVCRYASWMGGITWDEAAPQGRLMPVPHARIAISPDRHRILMRFRLGVWDLSNAYPLPGTLRCERVCMFCARRAELGLSCPASIIEDEQHVLLECPAFQSLRAEFADRLPFAPGASMLDVMACPDQRTLALFLERLHALFTATHNSTVDSLACHVCQSTDLASTMLICSGRCARGYHVGCLPEACPISRYQAWFCPSCLAARSVGDDYDGAAYAV